VRQEEEGRAARQQIVRRRGPAAHDEDDPLISGPGGDVVEEGPGHAQHRDGRAPDRLCDAPPFRVVLDPRGEEGALDRDPGGERLDRQVTPPRDGASLLAAGPGVGLETPRLLDRRVLRGADDHLGRPRRAHAATAPRA